MDTATALAGVALGAVTLITSWRTAPLASVGSW